MMDNNNWRPPPPVVGGGGEAAPETDDWRKHLPLESRERIVNKIMETLKRHLPPSGPDGLPELRKIATRFEEKIFNAASNQPDYLRKISLKMLTMETKSQNSVANSSKPADSGMQSQLQNQGTSIQNPVLGNQSQMRQQLLPQNIQNNMAPCGVQGSAGLTSTLPSVPGINQSSLPTVLNQNTSMQNMTSVSQNSLGNPMGQALAPNMYVNQRQMHGRQQMVSQQQPPPQNQQQYLYQQQLHSHIMKQKLQQGNIPHSMMSSHMQPQQQQQQQPPPQHSLLQPSHIQSPQQSVVQSSAVMQPMGMQATHLTGVQQNQQSSIQQTTQPTFQQHQQPVMRHQARPQQAVHQQQTSLQQQQTMPSQHQQQADMQQNQMINQQNIGDMQQQQQHRMLKQQNNLANLPPQQQQLLSQQNNLSNLHQQQLAPQNNVSGMHQQQPVMGTQSGNSSMQVGQQSAYMTQQPKISLQQQMQGGASNLLPGQQSQLLPVQQQLMSQMRPQSGQLPHQVGLQQQQASLQRDMQQRLQASGPMLQSAQNMMDHQKQLYQSQRGLAETSSMPLDSTAHTGQANGGDWQDEIYQKIKSLKELYWPELNEMYQKIAMKLQQHDSLPQQPKSEQLEKLKIFKAMLERLIAFLQVPKSEIHPGLKEKLSLYEKQIVHFLNTNRPRRQPPPHHMPSIQPQHSQSQVGQVQSNENQMNLQGSAASMQQNNLTSMQQGSLSSIPGVSNAQQNSLQPSSSMESGPVNAMNSLQQATLGSMQQNPVSAPPQLNVGAVSSHSGLNMLQSNATNLQANSKVLPQNLKQQQEQLMEQQLKQQYHHHQMQKQQLLQQQQHQLSQQAKQQQIPGQLQAHQMSQVHQVNEVNEMKIRPGMGLKPGVFQQHHSATGQRLAFPNQQLRSGSSFPNSSPQLLQAMSPQISQHSSPQIDQQSHLTSLTKTGTPASSPFVVPSPSTPLAPSPMPVDSENQKPASGMSSLSNAGNLAHQHTTAAPGGAQSLAIGTPGISASPLLAEPSGPDGCHGAASTAVSWKSTVTEQPIERLIRAVKAASPQALSDAVNDISSVVSMVDRIAGSAPGNGSRAAVGEDLAAMTKCRPQTRNFNMQDGPSAAKKIRRYTTAMPLNVASSAGSLNDSVKQLTDAESSDLESTATSGVKRLRRKVNHALIEEIREINRRLIDTVVDITDEDADPTAAAEGGEGFIVKCSFNAVSLSPGLKSQYGSALLSPIQPLRMLVPPNYPNCSPILLDKFPVEVSKEYEDFSSKAKSMFSISLRGLSQPMSLKEIARTWDSCSRLAILEYAEQSGGGSFSSKYGTWENCQTAT